MLLQQRKALGHGSVARRVLDGAKEQAHKVGEREGVHGVHSQQLSHTEVQDAGVRGDGLVGGASLSRQ